MLTNSEDNPKVDTSAQKIIDDLMRQVQNLNHELKELKQEKAKEPIEYDLTKTNDNDQQEVDMSIDDDEITSTTSPKDLQSKESNKTASVVSGDSM